MACPSVERDRHTDACSLMLSDVVTMSPTNVFTDYDMKISSHRDGCGTERLLGGDLRAAGRGRAGP